MSEYPRGALVAVVDFRPGENVIRTAEGVIVGDVRQERGKSVVPVEFEGEDGPVVLPVPVTAIANVRMPDEVGVDHEDAP